MKKIALIAFSLDPRYGTEDGYANTWLEIISKTYEVDVFTDVINKKGISSHQYINTTFHYVDGIRKWRVFGKKTGLVNIARNVFFRKVKEEIKKLDSKEFDLIHCITPAGIHSSNDIYKLGIPLIAGPLGGGLPTPPGFEEAFQGQRMKTYLRDLFFRWNLKWSRALKEYLVNADRVVLGLSLNKGVLPADARSKSVCIPDALVDVNYFIPLEKSKVEDKIRILFVGRLISNKGPMLILDAVKLCLERGFNNFIVELAGFGLLRNQLEQRIDELALGGHVTLLGSIEKENLLKKYQSSDIFCLPTLREPGGIAILEAMACGLPVVTSNYGGPAISVTDKCGIKIELKDYAEYVTDLADALIFLIDNPDIRQQMGIEGRKRAQDEFSIEALSKKILQLYQSVLKE